MLLEIASLAHIPFTLFDGIGLGRHVPDRESEVAALFNGLPRLTKSRAFSMTSNLA